MKKYRSAPFFRIASDPTSGSVVERMVALSGIYILSVYYYGPRILIASLLSVLTCAAFSVLCSLLFKNSGLLRADDILCSLLLTLLCPAGANLLLAPTGVSIMMIFRCFWRISGLPLPKISHIAVGWIFLAFCFPSQMFIYTEPGSGWLGLGLSATGVPSESVAELLSAGDLSHFEPVNLLLGHLAGPTGATAAVVIIACMVFMVVRRSAPWQVPVAALVSGYVFCLIFPRVSGALPMTALIEICGGSFLFCAVFLATEPGVFPLSCAGKWVFGILIGVLSMLLRRFLPSGQAAPVVILLLSAAAFMIDIGCFIVIDKIRVLAHRRSSSGRRVERDAERHEASENGD